MHPFSRLLVSESFDTTVADLSLVFKSAHVPQFSVGLLLFVLSILLPFWIFWACTSVICRGGLCVSRQVSSQGFRCFFSLLVLLSHVSITAPSDTSLFTLAPLLQSSSLKWCFESPIWLALHLPDVDFEWSPRGYLCNSSTPVPRMSILLPFCFFLFLAPWLQHKLFQQTVMHFTLLKTTAPSHSCSVSRLCRSPTHNSNLTLSMSHSYLGATNVTSTTQGIGPPCFTFWSFPFPLTPDQLLPSISGSRDTRMHGVVSILPCCVGANSFNSLVPWMACCTPLFCEVDVAQACLHPRVIVQNCCILEKTPLPLISSTAKLSTFIRSPLPYCSWFRKLNTKIKTWSFYATGRQEPITARQGKENALDVHWLEDISTKSVPS